MRPISAESEVFAVTPHVAHFLRTLENAVARDRCLAPTPWCSVWFLEPSQFAGNEMSQSLSCLDDGRIQSYVLQTTDIEQLHGFILSALDAGAAEVRFAAELSGPEGQDGVRAVYANRDEEWHALAELRSGQLGEWKVRGGTHFRAHFKVGPIPMEPAIPVLTDEDGLAVIRNVVRDAARERGESLSTEAVEWMANRVQTMLRDRMPRIDEAEADTDELLEQVVQKAELADGVSLDIALAPRIVERLNKEGSFFLTKDELSQMLSAESAGPSADEAIDP
jgi:hypothetical protein